jgi:hypothetical protein
MGALETWFSSIWVINTIFCILGLLLVRLSVHIMLKRANGSSFENSTLMSTLKRAGSVHDNTFSKRLFEAQNAVRSFLL